AGFHHTLRSGVRVLNLFEAAANVDPLQFRMSRPLGREVVARAQELTEQWAVELCASPRLAAQGGDNSPAASRATSPAAGQAKREAGGVEGARAGRAYEERPSTPGRTALHSSMGGGGVGAGAWDAAGHELAYGCDCRPWWLASVDEAAAHGDFGRGM
ncbi:hypothetical protein MNEG_5587, partial [Monoraphidium neglectum]